MSQPSEEKQPVKTRCALLQFDTRITEKEIECDPRSSPDWGKISQSQSPYIEKDSLCRLIQRNREYCRKHGYEHRFFHKNRYSKILPPYWNKVFLLRDLMEEKDQDSKYKYTHVWWMDSDAVVDHMEMKIDEIFEKRCTKEQFMMYAPDPPQWPSTFMAGVFIFKNSPEARTFVDEWIDKYRPNMWRAPEEEEEENDKWTCGTEWAGPDYEQGSGAQLIKKYGSKYTHMIPWHFFHSLTWKNVVSPDIFSCHFAGGKKATIDLYCRARGLYETTLMKPLTIKDENEVKTDKEKTRICIVTLRPKTPNQELLWDYNRQVAEKRGYGFHTFTGTLEQQQHGNVWQGIYAVNWTLQYSHYDS